MENVVPIADATPQPTVTVVQGAVHVFTQLAHAIHPNVSRIKPDPMALLEQKDAPQYLANLLVQNVDRLVAEDPDMGSLPEAQRDGFSDKIVNTLLAYSDKIETGVDGIAGHGMAGWLTYMHQLVSFLGDSSKRDFLQQEYEEFKDAPNKPKRSFLDALLKHDPENPGNLLMPVHYFGKHYDKQINAMKAMLNKKTAMLVVANDDADAVHEAPRQRGPSLGERIMQGLRSVPQKWETARVRNAFARSGAKDENAQVQTVQLEKGTIARWREKAGNAWVASGVIGMRMISAVVNSMKDPVRGGLNGRGMAVVGLVAFGVTALVVNHFLPGLIDASTLSGDSLQQAGNVADQVQQTAAAVPVPSTGGAVPADQVAAVVAPPPVSSPIAQDQVADVASGLARRSTRVAQVMADVATPAPAPIEIASVDATAVSDPVTTIATPSVDVGVTSSVDASLPGTSGEFNNGVTPAPGQPINLLEGLGYDKVPANPGDTIIATISPPSPLSPIY